MKKKRNQPWQRLLLLGVAEAGRKRTVVESATKQSSAVPTIAKAGWIIHHWEEGEGPASDGDVRLEACSVQTKTMHHRGEEKRAFIIIEKRRRRTNTIV